LLTGAPRRCPHLSGLLPLVFGCSRALSWRATTGEPAATSGWRSAVRRVRGARRLSQWAADAVWLQVFDVSRGAKHYAPGGGYAGFAGRDGTRAFVSGEFTEEGLTDDVAGLSDEDAAGVIYWRDFYRSNYTFLGLLTGGAFYDAAGEPLPPVEALEAGAARRQALLKRVAAETRVAPSCDAAWSADAGGEVWCGEGRQPRRATYAHHPPRCLCVPPTLEAGVAAAEAGMELYPDCAPQEQRCSTAEAEAAVTAVAG
jgi:hypothetical protein